MSSYGMSDLLRSFPESVWVKTKHAKNSCVDLWGQPMILKVVELFIEVLEKTTYEGFWLVEGFNNIDEYGDFL